MAAKTITLDDLYTGQQALAKDVQGLTGKYSDLYSGQQAIAKDLRNLTELVTAGFETMNERFDRVEARVDQLESRMVLLENRMGRLETAQLETNSRLERLEGTGQALYNDVIELYKLTADLKRRYDTQPPSRELSARLRRIETFIRKVAAQTGIPYPG